MLLDIVRRRLDNDEAIRVFNEYSRLKSEHPMLDVALTQLHLQGDRGYVLSLFPVLSHALLFGLQSVSGGQRLLQIQVEKPALEEEVLEEESLIGGVVFRLLRDLQLSRQPVG